MVIILYGTIYFGGKAKWIARAEAGSRLGGLYG